MNDGCLAEKDRSAARRDGHHRNARKTGLSRRQNPVTFLASDEDERKCCGLACMPVFPPTISRHWPMQNRAMREYAVRRGWTIALQVREVSSGAVQREAREKLLEAARRREIDVVLVWRLDRWGRSVTDLLTTLQELEHLGVGFVSLTEALDLTTPAGRAMAGLLAVFAAFEREILQERTELAWRMPGRMGNGWVGLRPLPYTLSKIRKLHRAGVAKAEIARRLQIGRTSVRRILARPISPRNIGQLALRNVRGIRS